MRLAFVDFETQGNDAASTNVTEVGAMLIRMTPDPAHPELMVFQPEETLSQLVYLPEYEPQTPEIIELTGITDEMLKAEGVPPQVALSALNPILAKADYVLAHNKAFDQKVYEAAAPRAGVPVLAKEWICTLHEVPYPDKYKCKKLAHLAYDHGVIVDPTTLHRALDDVHLMARFITTRYKIEDILAYRNEPWAYIAAKILGPWHGKGGDGGVGKAQASHLGYSWERPRGTEGIVFPKMWVKRVKENQLQAEKAKAPFPIVRVTLTQEPKKEDAI